MNGRRFKSPKGSLSLSLSRSRRFGYRFWRWALLLSIMCTAYSLLYETLFLFVSSFFLLSGVLAYCSLLRVLLSALDSCCFRFYLNICRWISRCNIWEDRALGDKPRCNRSVRYIYCSTVTSACVCLESDGAAARHNKGGGGERAAEHPDGSFSMSAALAHNTCTARQLFVYFYGGGKDCARYDRTSFSFVLLSFLVPNLF